MMICLNILIHNYVLIQEDLVDGANPLWGDSLVNTMKKIFFVTSVVTKYMYLQFDEKYLHSVDWK